MKQLQFLFFFSILGIKFSCSQINVFDTLLHIPYFSDYLHHDERKNYKLNTKKQLVRKYHLKDGALHYHKDFEDSLFKTLRSIYGQSFSNLEYVSEDKINWTLPKSEKFKINRGKTIYPEQLNRLYASEADLKLNFSRLHWLQKEDDYHLFYHRYFLTDSKTRNIYCFNELSGKPEGTISFSTDSTIINELSFFPDGKVFYQLNNGTLEIFSETGKKLFERNEKTIIAFDEAGAIKWKNENNLFLNSQSNKATLTLEKEYFDMIENIWRKNFSN